ncbi:hypothetical protein KQX54_018039 [Cotesia glomerata]|uniref:Uncharacterized protein n=1 Tax=Cotesia glomerata TaxID=32391 RepID=A0AAV7I3A6_COTGL|nr:hypothetical protein KQX54_018039 [Cotesia glomerata]
MQEPTIWNNSHSFRPQVDVSRQVPGIVCTSRIEACHDAWTQLRLSPMFGCICPGNQAKKRCDKIFSTVNHNPCVVSLRARYRNRCAECISCTWINEDREDFHPLNHLPTRPIDLHLDSRAYEEIRERKCQ